VSHTELALPIEISLLALLCYTQMMSVKLGIHTGPIPEDKF